MIVFIEPTSVLIELTFALSVLEITLSVMTLYFMVFTSMLKPLVVILATVNKLTIIFEGN